MSTNARAVHLALTARVVDLVPQTLYSHGTAAWRPSLTPLVPEWEPASTAHLSFFWDDRTDQPRGTRARHNGEESQIECEPRLRLLFQLLPGAGRATEDWRLARIAAEHVRAWLLVDGWTDDFTLDEGNGPVERVPVGPTGEWLRVDVPFFLEYTSAMAL